MQIKEATLVYKPTGQSVSFQQMDGANKTWEYMRKVYENGRYDVEQLYVIPLNTKLYAQGYNMVSLGTVNETTAHVRDVLRIAILANAYGFILVHNHPSFIPHPSSADMDFTIRLKEASRTMQINFVDHVIMGRFTELPEEGMPADAHKYYSFKEAGYL